MAKGVFKRRLKWFPGDLFAVPLSDGSFGFAQAVAAVESWAVDFALLSVRSPQAEPLAAPPLREDAIAVQATWRTAITGGHWKFVGSTELVISLEACPNQRLISARESRGLKHSDWGLLEDFLSAYHGLFPWNLYSAFDFDSYLLHGVERPAAAIVLGPEQVALARAHEKERAYAA